MSFEELANQLEFYRDIGISQVDVDPVRINSARGAHQQSEAMLKPKVGGTISLDHIREDLGECQRCELAGNRTHIVFGSGNSRAHLVFVGEAPGSEEDRQGLPFVGRAGQLLTKIIESIGLKREEVYICNVLKCRPPNNRNPEALEVETCSPFLRNQLEAINPQIVCCLGTFAAQTVLGMKLPISKLRGQFHEIDGIQYIATFHPAYLLRNASKKREVWEDMKKIRSALTQSQS